LRRVAPVDHQLRPGDERRLVGREVEHAISDVVRLTEVTDRVKTL
jgi:hypothetical protein